MIARNIKAEYAKWVAQQQFTHAITLKPNNPRLIPTADFLRRKLIDCHAAVDRKMLGRNFNQSRFRDQRSLFIGMLEGFPDSGHLHIMAKIHDSMIDRFDTMCVNNALPVWDTKVVGGTSRVDPISDAAGWAHYSLKHVHHLNDFERIMVLPESHHIS